jgi:DNA-binding transcriptional ArsR family regulator
MASAIDRLATLGDPTRRHIFELLARSPSSVAELADRVTVSRPAVSQHLRALTEAGLVRHRVVGTRHVYRVDPAGLASLRGYLDSLWETALDQYRLQAERTARTKRRRG